MAERVRAETNSMRKGGEQLAAEAERVDDAVRRLVEAIDRIGPCWGKGEIADAFAPKYLQGKEEIVDAAENAVKRLRGLGRVRQSAEHYEGAERENVQRAQGS